MLRARRSLHQLARLVAAALLAAFLLLILGGDACLPAPPPDAAACDHSLLGRLSLVLVANSRMERFYSEVFVKSLRAFWYSGTRVDVL